MLCCLSCCPRSREDENERIGNSSFDMFSFSHGTSANERFSQGRSRRGFWDSASGLFRLVSAEEEGETSTSLFSWFSTNATLDEVRLDSALLAHDDCPLVSSALEARLQGDVPLLVHSDSQSQTMGLALHRALEAQRSRQSMYSKVRGSPASPGPPTCTSPSNIGCEQPAVSIVAETDRDHDKMYSLTVQRWGLRHDRVESQETPEISLDKGPIEESVSPGSNSAVEIEFELLVQVGASKRICEWASTSASEARGGRVQWTVWRTGAEVMQLHASLVSAFGDLAPRKPRLRSMSPGGNCSPSDIQQDVRVIGIYLMSLLRGRVSLEFPSVLSFLEVWDYDSTADTVIGGGFQGDQEKWRKLFISLRVRVKPHEVGIRCRLFEGVVSGDEISSWLCSNGYSSSEAGDVGQRFVDCGLLVHVCSGYSHSSETEDNTAAVTGADSMRPSTQWSETLLPRNQNYLFSNQQGYLFKFQHKHSTSLAVGKFVLFGTTITVSIPRWSNKGGVDTTGSGDQQTHIEYAIECRHGGDEWTSWRRYSEFSDLQKRLLGLKSLGKQLLSCSQMFPPKTPFRSGGGAIPLRAAQTQDELEIRRCGLEKYLLSCVALVVGSQIPEAQIILAHFLDASYEELNVH